MEKNTIGLSLMHLGTVNQSEWTLNWGILIERERAHDLILTFLSLCLSLCHYLTVLITVALEQILISGSVSPSTLFFFPKLFGIFCMSI